MRVLNAGTQPITINLRDGRSFLAQPGGPAVDLRDSDVSLLDDSVYLMGLFNAGTLVAQTDAGAPFPSFPASVNSVDAAAGRALHVRARVGASGARTLVDESGAEIPLAGQPSGPASTSVSSKYLAFFPLDQPASSGIPRDISRNTRSMYRMSGLTDAACWTNPGWATSGAGQNLGLILNRSDVDLSANDDRNIIIAFEMLMAAPGATTTFFGWSSGAGSPGVTLNATSAGKLTGSVRTTAGTAVTSGATLSNVADGAAHQVVVAVDCRSNFLRMAVDGYYTTHVNFGTTSTHHTVNQGADLGLGAGWGADQTTTAVQFRNLHLLAVSEIPSNFGAFAHRLSKTMSRMLLEGEI